MIKFNIKCSGTISDGEHIQKFTEEDIRHIDIKFPNKTKLTSNIQYALKLEELVKESTKAGNPPIIAGYLLQLLKEAKK